MNYFKILEGLTKLVKSGQIKSVDEALAMLQRGGAKIDGILRQGVVNIFKKGKARDPDFGTNVTKMPVDDAGVPFNPNTLKSTTEKRGVENLFKKKLTFLKALITKTLHYRLILKSKTFMMNW
jgi:hypothetical protein